MPKMQFFGKHHFESKEKVRERLKLISRQLGPIKHALDHDLLQHMLLKHPASKTYCSSLEEIAGFSVELRKSGPFAPTNQFVVHRTNGTNTSISFEACLDSKKQYERNILYKALRCEIQSQINEFHKTHLLPEVCPECKRYAPCQVDHLRFFSDLSSDFLARLQLRGDSVSPVGGMGADDSRVDCPWGPHDKTSLWLINRNQALEWQEFHRRHAILRYLCGPCNRKRKPSRVSCHQ